jgi:hypothetical protein
MNDGRVVSNFVLQALQNEPITVKFIIKEGFICFSLSFRFMEMENKHVHFNMLVILLMVLLL